MKLTFTSLKKIIFLIYFTFIVSASFAQLTLNGELRPRFEYKHGIITLVNDEKESTVIISQRTRFKLGFIDKIYTIGISFQDVRKWGDNPLSNPYDNNSSFHEAWAELKLTNQLFVKLGRQELLYDDNRLFSGGEWSQQGRSHDMALVKWNPDTTIKVNLGFAFNQPKEQMDIGPDSAFNNYKSMQFIWMHKDWDKNRLSLLFANIGNEQFNSIAPNVITQHIRYTQTFGGRYSYEDKLFSLNIAAYLQKGKDTANRNINANYANIDFTIVLNNKLNLVSRAEHFSGTSTKDITPLKTNYSFNPLFGGSHRVNGTMDYFYCNNHLDNVGLNDYSLSLSYLKDKYSSLFTVHLFNSDAKIENMANEMESLNKFLGTEFDLQLIYYVTNNITFTCGYSQLFATRTMEVLKEGHKSNTNNYAFMLISFKPNFLK